MNLSPVLIAIVDKRDALVVLDNAIDAYQHFGIRGKVLLDDDMIDGLLIAVVHFELFPVRRETGRKTQPVNFKTKTEK